MIRLSLIVLFSLSLGLFTARAAEPTAAAKPYPLKVCIVTDNDLGSMGEETSLTHEGQVVKFCCAPCERKFLKNPARYLAKLTPEKAKADAPAVTK
ncbi:MAG: hypothetical protein ABW223_04250 [Rariglobus sp.]